MSTVDPAGPSARIAANLWWWMFGYASLVVLAVVALWLYALGRRHRHWPEDHARRVAQRWIIGGGVLLPFVSVALLLAFGIPAGYRMLPGLVAGEPPLAVQVIGRQWQWEARYPDGDVRTLNVLYVPAGRPVDVHTTSEDVIHSFWVPRLAGKIDAIPGRYNVVRLLAEEPGDYAGQCAEFCGLSHAHMRMTVRALPPDEYEAQLQALQAGGNTDAARARALPVAQP